MTPGINASDISEDGCDLPGRTGRKKAVCYAARVRQDLFTEVSSLAGGVEIQHFSRSTRFARPVSLSQVHTQVNQSSRRCQDLTVGSIVWKASPDATPRLTAPLIPSSCTLSSIFIAKINLPRQTAVYTLSYFYRTIEYLKSRSGHVVHVTSYAFLKKKNHTVM